MSLLDNATPEEWDKLNIAEQTVGEIRRQLLNTLPILKTNEPCVSQSALKIQTGGRHYKDLKIQPVEYIHANNIPFIEGCVIKYVTRWRSKNGLQDLEKAKHFIDLLIELEDKNET